MIILHIDAEEMNRFMISPFGDSGVIIKQIQRFRVDYPFEATISSSRPPSASFKVVLTM